MQVNLLPYEDWEKLNAAVSEELRVDPKVESVRCFQGLAAAVFEIALGTAQFYSHKRSIAFIKRGSPWHLGILPYLYKEGYEVQFKPDSVSDIEWVESLKKDTCFAVFPEDHAVTGEVYPTDELDRLLNEKRIFSLKVSHQSHLHFSQELRPYTARICSLDLQTAVARLGARFKSPVLLSSQLHWDKTKFLDTLKKCFEGAHQNRALIQGFEAKLPAGFHALLQNSNRIFDRALIYSEDVAGEAVQQFLASNLHFQLKAPGWEERLETTHLCRWGGLKSYDEWWDPRPRESILRGLLILGTQVLEHPDVRALLERALRECQIANFS